MIRDHYYKLEGLAEAAGVSERTIRYYTAEGLLPPPEARGRFALYTDAHLSRLRLITRLKEAFLPLEHIQRQLRGLSDSEVTALLEQKEAAPSPAPPPTSSASAYVARLLATPSAPPVQMNSPEPPAETWQRITLAPGVELHVRAMTDFVTRLIAYAQKIRKNTP